MNAEMIKTAGEILVLLLIFLLQIKMFVRSDDFQRDISALRNETNNKIDELREHTEEKCAKCEKFVAMKENMCNIKGDIQRLTDKVDNIMQFLMKNFNK